MPASRPVAIALLSVVAACTPSQFAWDETRDTELARYRRSFATACGTRFDAALDGEGFAALALGTRLLWLGDYHTDADQHARMAALLERLQRGPRGLALALESIATEDEPLVASFLAGERSLASLRERVRLRWPGSWLDDASLDPDFYCWLLSFARQHRLPVVALEGVPRPPLEARDAAIAARVEALAAAEPDRLVVAIVGQAHLVGEGALVSRCSLPQVVVGGVPPGALAAAAPAAPSEGTFLRSDGGLWWFADALRR